MTEAYKEWQEGPITFRVTLEHDDCPDISWMGEYADQPDDYVFDRQNGWLIVGKPEPEYPDVSGMTDDEADIAIDEYELAYDEWADFPWEVVADVRSNFRRNDYRYWKPSENSRPPGREKSWAHVQDVLEYYKADRHKMLRFEIDAPEEPTYEEAIRLLDILYMCQDYERIVGLERGDWYFMGVIVTAHVDGEEVAYESLWGIESDAGDYIEEVIKDCAALCKDQLPKTVEHYREVARKIEEAIA